MSLVSAYLEEATAHGRIADSQDITYIFLSTDSVLPRSSLLIIYTKEAFPSIRIAPSTQIKGMQFHP